MGPFTFPQDLRLGIFLLDNAKQQWFWLSRIFRPADLLQNCKRLLSSSSTLQTTVPARTRMSSLCTLAAAVVACIGKSLPPSAPQVPGVGRVFWGPSRGWMLSPVFSPNHPDKAVWLAASASEQGNPAEATWLLSHFSNPFSTLFSFTVALYYKALTPIMIVVTQLVSELSRHSETLGFDHWPGY